MSAQTEIDKLIERNKRVEADKAWETSTFRIVCVTAMTYLVMLVFMIYIRIDRPFVSAAIPTLGYFLSTQSLPFIKRWWIKRRKEV